MVADMRSFGRAEPPGPLVYQPIASSRFGSTSIVMRSASPLSVLAPMLRSNIRALDADIPMPPLTTAAQLARREAKRRFVASVLTAFAALALGLAALGVYGVTSYLTTRRRHEIGVRMALGAGRSGVFRLIVRQAAPAIGGGLLVGAVVAVAATRFLEASLYEVTTTDSRTFAAAITMLAAVGFCGAVIPAVRATQVDPVEALREE